MSGTLTQAEADALLAMEKVADDSSPRNFPGGGESLQVGLRSPDGREEFILDIYRGRIDLAKVTYQNRARVTTVLARLDLGGPPHTNPDGTLVKTPHLHLYREGYADKWAFDVPDDFLDLDDARVTLYDFLGYCNVTDPPTFQDRLMA